MAGFFDEEDVVTSPKPVQKPVPAKQASSFFDPEDVAAPVAAKPVSTFFEESDVISKPVPDAIEKEIRETSWYDRPILLPKEIKDEEIQQLAAKYGTSAQELRDAVPLMSGLPEKVRPSDIVKGAAGFAGEAVTLGVPQKLFRMAQDPKQEAALDELKDLIDTRKSYAQYAAEFAVPGVGTAKLAKAVGGGLKGAAVVGAATGAAGGFGGSKAGEGLKGATIGAVAGAGLGVAAEKLVQKIASKAQKPISKAEEETFKSFDFTKLDDRAEKELSEEGNKLVDQLALGDKRWSQVGQEDVDKILNTEYDPVSLRAVIDPKTEAGQAILQRTDKELIGFIGEEAAIKRTLAEDIVKNTKADFVSDMTGKTLRDPELVEKEYSKLLTQGERFVPEVEFKNFRKSQIMQKYITSEGIYDLSPDSKFAQGLSKFVDTKMHLRVIDSKHNTPLETVLNTLSQNRNLMGAAHNKFKEELNTLARSAGEEAELSAQSGKLRNAIEQKWTGSLSPDEQKLAQGFRKYFDDAYDFVTNRVEEQGVLGVSIPKVEDYLSRMLVEVPEARSRIEMQLSRAAKDASAVLGKQVDNIAQLNKGQLSQVAQTSEAVQNLVKYLDFVSGESTKLDTGSKLAAAVSSSLNSEKDIRILDKVARGTLERTAPTGGGIPDFLLEKNLFKAADRYIYDMLSNIYQREPLRKMNYIADQLERVGDKFNAEYVRRVVEDTLGTRSGTAARFMRDAQVELARKFDPKIQAALERGDKTSAIMWGTLKEMGNLPAFLANQIYPNVLGWRATPILTNVISGIARGAPELGGAYGYANYTRGTVWALKNWAQAKQQLYAKGYVPSEWTEVSKRALSEGIRASFAVDIPLRALEAFNKVGMALFTKSEELNRVTILGMSKMMAYDLERGSAAAARSLSKFPKDIQRQVIKAGGNREAVEDALMSHLNSVIAMNYNRPSLYEFGRTMGPIFSTFAKWPTTIAGEVIAEYKTKPFGAATKRTLERYALPLMGLAAVDYLMQDRVEESPRLQKLVGKTGVTKAAPISAAGGFVTGELFTPPAIDVIMQDVIVPASKADGFKLMRGVDRAAFTYFPGAGMVRFLTDDLPTLITGEAREGSTQAEKSLGTLGVTR